MSDPLLEEFVKFPPAALKRLRADYKAAGIVEGVARCDAALERRATTQTEELQDCGKLFAHRYADDDTGRTKTRYTGDVAAFMAPFVPPPQVVRLNPETFPTGANSELAQAQFRQHAARQAEIQAAGIAALSRK